MIKLAFRFETGRIHTTPWDTHVNEGEVEWPPSPWRLCRALLATGFSKLGWKETPENAKKLLAQLVEVAPSYYLPPGVVAHSRHFMPTATTTTKVLDTFVHVGEAELFVFWPVELEKEQRDLLEMLVRSLSYLGRAESWVTGRVLAEDEAGPEPNVMPCLDEEERSGARQVVVLGTLPSVEYADWRETAWEQAVQAESAVKKLTAAAKKKLALAYPETMLDCLLSSTSAFRSSGWSQPPGTKKVLYWMPHDALAPQRPLERRLEPLVVPYEYALFALVSDTVGGTLLPPLHRVLPLAERVHKALVSRVCALTEHENCPEITGCDEQKRPLLGHGHAHFIPLDLDQDGRLDHLVAYAPMKLGFEAQRAMSSLRKLNMKEGKLHVTLTSFTDRAGLLAALARVGHFKHPFQESRVWQTWTPFIAPRYLKKSGKNTIEGQVRDELLQRGLPEPVRIVAETGQSAARAGFHEFIRQRLPGAPRPPSTVPWLIQLEFAEPVKGPLLIGYGSHLGLGCMMPG